MDGHWGCFRPLATVNSSCEHLCTSICWDMCFEFFGKSERRRIMGSYDMLHIIFVCLFRERPRAHACTSGGEGQGRGRERDP